MKRPSHSVYSEHPEQLKAALDNPELNHSEHEVYWPALKKLFPRDAHSVLDFGCGPGTYTEELASLYPNATVLGLDNAAEILPTNGQVTYIEADILAQLDAAPGPFDLIVAKMVLHYVDEDDMTMLCAELVRRLEPGGVLVGSVPHPLNSAHYLADMGTIASAQLIEREVAHSDIRSKMWHRPPDEWLRIFEWLLIDNPDEQFLDYDYQLVTDSVMNDDGKWRRYNFAFVPGLPATLETHRRINTGY